MAARDVIHTGLEPTAGRLARHLIDVATRDRCAPVAASADRALDESQAAVERRR